MSDRTDNPYKESYADYNRILRTWFVAFGIGVPAALILNPETRELVASSWSVGFIVFSLITGTIVQIAMAVLNKYIAWCNYHIELNKKKPEDQQTKMSRFVEWVADLTEYIWIDIFADIATGVLFIVAIILLYTILL